MTTARITFENATGHDISAVSVAGCVTKRSVNSKPAESTTMWIEVKNACSLVLFYKVDREPKLENSFWLSYAQQWHIATYRIGSK